MRSGRRVACRISLLTPVENFFTVSTVNPALPRIRHRNKKQGQHVHKTEKDKRTKKSSRQTGKKKLKASKEGRYKKERNHL